MKFRSFRVAVLSAFVLTSPLLSFAAGQPKLHMPSKTDGQNVVGATPAVQQGKGSGTMRSQVAIPSNSRPLGAPGARQNDSAYRK
jgi:hypothetical protein